MSTSQRAVLISRGTTFSWTDRKPLRPPIASSPSIQLEEIPHAESSAAATARSRRFVGWSSSILSVRQDLVSAPDCFCTIPPRRHISTRPPKTPRHLFAFNYRSPLTPEAKEQAYTLWSARETHYAGDIGWKTPADLASGSTSMANWKTKPSDLPKWLRTDMEREFVRRSTFREALTLAYDSLEDLNYRSETSDEEERTSLLQQLAATIEEVLNSTNSVPESHAAQAPPVDSADAIAFSIICRSIVLVQIQLEVSDQEILTLFRSMRKTFSKLALPQYHRILSTAGLYQRDELVLKFFTEAQIDWEGATDEWMLYARAKALSRLGKSRHVLNEYWKEYENCKAAPPQAYGRPNTGDTKRKLHPPRYLFVVLLEHQVRSASKTSSGYAYARSKKVLEAMRFYGFEPDENIYLTLLGTSPSLRLRLPEIVDSVERARQVGEKGQSTHRESVLLRLLRRRVQDIAVRDVFRLLDLMNVERLRAQRVATSTSAVGVRSSIATRNLDPEEELQAHVLASQLYAFLGLPNRALFHFQACWRVRQHDIDLKYSRQAAINVIRAYNIGDQPQAGLAFGFSLINLGQAPCEEAPRLSPHTSLYRALLQLAATLPSYAEAISQTRVILDHILHHGISFDNAVRSGLTALFNAAIGPYNNHLEGVKKIVRNLVGYAEGDLSRSPPPEEGAQREKRMAGSLSAPQRRRMGSFLHQLHAEGFVDRLQLKATQKRTSRDLRALRQERWNLLREKENTLWLCEHSSKVFRDTENPLVTQHHTPDQGFPIPETAQAVENSDTSHLTDGTVLSQEADSPASVSRPVGDPDEEEPLTTEPDESLTSLGYALRLRIYSVIRRDHVYAAQLYRSMLRHGVKPSMLHISPIVEGLSLDRRVDEAIAVAQSARKSFGVLTTARIEAAVLLALIRSNRALEAREELREWIKAGGKVTRHLSHAFKRRVYPRLAHPRKFAAALRKARAEQQPLNLEEVDDAFRYLLRSKKYYTALRLVLRAVKRTGMASDYCLRRGVRKARHRIRKILHRRAQLRKDTQDRGRGSQTAPRPSYLDEKPLYKPSTGHGPEDTQDRGRGSQIAPRPSYLDEKPLHQPSKMPGTGTVETRTVETRTVEKRTVEKRTVEKRTVETSTDDTKIDDTETVRMYLRHLKKRPPRLKRRRHWRRWKRRKRPKRRRRERSEKGTATLSKALLLSGRVLEVLNEPSNKEIQEGKRSLAEFRKQLERLMMDVARGMYSKSYQSSIKLAEERRIAREQREAEQWLAQQEDALREEQKEAEEDDEFETVSPSFPWKGAHGDTSRDREQSRRGGQQDQHNALMATG